MSECSSLHMLLTTNNVVGEKLASKAKGDLAQR